MRNIFKRVYNTITYTGLQYVESNFVSLAMNKTKQTFLMLKRDLFLSLGFSTWLVLYDDGSSLRSSHNHDSTVIR